MKKIIIATIAVISTFNSFGQEINKMPEIKRNSIYVEAFGQGLFNSFSFDRLYNTDKKVKTSFSTGITIIPHRELFVFGVPISYNFLFGQKNSHLELGVGFTALYLKQDRIEATEGVTDINGINTTNSFVGHKNNFYSYFTPKIGYRFQKNTGGLFLRVTLTPSIAGINSIGGIEGGKLIKQRRQTEYFSSAAFFGYRAFPWAGLSIGWTIKK